VTDFEAAYGDQVRTLAEGLLRFDTTGGNERPAQEFLHDRLADLGFETYTWSVDADALAAHPSFPSVGGIDAEDRPSVAGVLEFGGPSQGRTLVLDGHVDVVPAVADQWSGDPFDPRWEGDRLLARGAADMKSQLAACVFAARHVADRDGDLDGRLVVESVAGEEDGGLGAATAAASNPYPFERDAAIITEPTDLRVVTATEGCLMGQVSIEGRPAHAARRWEGESVWPHFERVRQAFAELEAERATRLTHPLYERFEVPWPIVFGRLEAGTWASNVPGTLRADVRVGVAPGESVGTVEAACRERLDGLAAGQDVAIGFERLGVQFESAEVDVDEPIVTSLQESMTTSGIDSIEPIGETYGSDARHYLAAGIPTVVFGPGRIEEAHFPDESTDWPDVLWSGTILADTARRFLSTPVR
jgi:acetylornithine deacetylase